MRFGWHGGLLLVVGALGAAACGISGEGELGTPGTDAAVSPGVDASHVHDGSSKDVATHDAAKADGTAHDAKPSDTGTGDSAQGDSGAQDSGMADVVTHDTGTDSGAHDATRPPPDASCNTSACPTPPSSSWSVVEFAPSRATTCPAGFTTSDLLESPGTGTACSCGSTCDMTSAPDCIDVNLQATFGTGCTTSAPAISSGGGACQGLTVSFNPTSAEVTAPDVTLQCTGPTPATNPSGVTGQEDRVCALDPTTCASEACGASVMAGFQTCLVASGDQTCPSDLPTKHAVGTAVITCGTCPCTASATCDGVLTVYANGDCGGASVAVPTGACTAVGHTVASYDWAPSTTPPVSCTVGAPSAPSVTLGNLATVCCP